MKSNRAAILLVSALAPALLLTSSAVANPSGGPIYGSAVSMDVTNIGLTETLNADSTGWDIAFNQYDQSGLLAQYTVTTDSGDSCTTLTADSGAPELCTLSLVNNDPSVIPAISTVSYEPVVAMASGVLGGTLNGGIMPLSDGVTTTTVDVTPVNLDTTNATVSDNGDGTFTLSIPAYTVQQDSGSYTFSTTAGDVCTSSVAASATADCVLTPSDGQMPIISSVTWSPIVPTDIIAYSMKSASGSHMTAGALSNSSGSSSLAAAGIIGLLTTLGCLWLNARARRRHTF